ncbi:MAG: ABC transporter ATP-binding protein [Treponema sp.]|nr:ABC transporter ATP-binding protein [Treponema sp.]
MKAILAERLMKVYANGTKALDDVSFSIKEGGIFGFLGPNGAGKTTAVKVLNGILAPSGGSCGVFGMNPGTDTERVHAISGVVTEKAQMYNDLSGLRNLLFYGTLFGAGKEEARGRALELLERLELIEAKDQKLSTYSTGMRQRLSLARALMHRPKLLFLDEPTSGLDPESAQNVNNLIRELARRHGTTVFLCTHQLRYAEEICSGYGLIDDGRMLAEGSLDELRSPVFSGLIVSIKSDVYPPGLAFREEDGFARIEVGSEEEIPGLVKSIVDFGGKVTHVAARRLSLEEIYFALIQKRKEEQR